VARTWASSTSCIMTGSRPSLISNHHPPVPTPISAAAAPGQVTQASPFPRATTEHQAPPRRSRVDQLALQFRELQLAAPAPSDLVCGPWPAERSCAPVTGAAPSSRNVSPTSTARCRGPALSLGTGGGHFFGLRQRFAWAGRHRPARCTSEAAVSIEPSAMQDQPLASFAFWTAPATGQRGGTIGASLIPCIARPLPFIKQ